MSTSVPLCPQMLPPGTSPGPVTLPLCAEDSGMFVSSPYLPPELQTTYWTSLFMCFTGLLDFICTKPDSWFPCLPALGLPSVFLSQ